MLNGLNVHYVVNITIWWTSHAILEVLPYVVTMMVTDKQQQKYKELEVVTAALQPVFRTKKESGNKYM